MINYFPLIVIFQLIKRSYIFYLLKSLNPQPCDLRKGDTLHFPPAHSTCHVINSLLLQGGFLWNNLPREIKENLSTEEFKGTLMQN